MTACELASQTPQVVVVTATPEPADAGPPLPTVPTWTPEPTWTPQPTPTPTATPFPTPTPNLQQLGIIKVQGCGDGNTFITSTVDESGTALGKFQRDYGSYEYRRWLPGPVYGTGKCASAGYAEWPTPTPDPRGGENRIQQVAYIAKEACNDPQIEWRPAAETFALGYREGSYRESKWSGLTHYQQYFFYDAITNRCVYTRPAPWDQTPIADRPLTEYAQQAWHAWPEILPTPTPEAPPTPIPTATADAPAEAAPTTPPTAAP